jgi:ParB-like nuclease domain
MKDAKGHGSNPRGAHSTGIEQAITPVRMEIPLEDIRPWQNTDPDLVKRYAQAMRKGEKFPPIEVATDFTGQNKWVVRNGHHRLAAEKLLGLPTITADRVQPSISVAGATLKKYATPFEGAQNSWDLVRGGKTLGKINQLEGTNKWESVVNGVSKPHTNITSALGRVQEDVEFPMLSERRAYAAGKKA